MEDGKRFFTAADLDALGATAALAGAALDRLGESPLWPVGADQPLVVRLLRLPTWGPACSVRVEVHGWSWWMVGRELSGAEAGFELGELARREGRGLSVAEAEQVAALWGHLRFWSLPPTIVEDGDVLDGTLSVLEGAERGRRRLVLRNDVEWGETFGELGDLLIELAGLDA